MTESEAREYVSMYCHDLADKVFETAGGLIAQSVATHGDDHKAIYEDARAIVNAVVMELTYYRKG